MIRLFCLKFDLYHLKMIRKINLNSFTVNIIKFYTFNHWHLQREKVYGLNRFPNYKRVRVYIAKGNRKLVLITIRLKYVGPSETCKAVLKTNKTTRSINLIVNVPNRKISMCVEGVQRSITHPHTHTLGKRVKVVRAVL